MILYPPPLRAGQTVGVTGPSGGVAPKHHARLDLALGALKARGFHVVEGACLRSEHRHVSGPKEARANDFMRLWLDPRVDMIFPPWGGELLVEILPLLDFEALKRTPKWILGYSDTSTLLFALTILTGFATAHGTNLMDSIPNQTDALTAQALTILETPHGGSVRQEASAFWQKTWTNLEKEPERGFNLTEPTAWKILGARTSVDIHGRLMGGCLDTLAALTGTRYGDLPAFARGLGNDKVIVYLENCEQSPCALSRILWNFKAAGWFDRAAGLVLGRSAAPDRRKETDLGYEDALAQALGELNLPVIFDADIGHLPPQMTLVNGALAHVHCAEGRGHVVQTFA